MMSTNQRCALSKSIFILFIHATFYLIMCAESQTNGIIYLDCIRKRSEIFSPAVNIQYSVYEKYPFFHFLPLLISYMHISMEYRVATVKSRSQTFILALIKCANSFRRKMINSLRSFYDIFIICIFLVVSSFFSGTALSVSNQMKPF